MAEVEAPRVMLVTEAEFASAAVNSDGDLTFTRENGEVFNAGKVRVDVTPEILDARDQAMDAAARAEAVGDTNDTIMAGVLRNPDSVFAEEINATVNGAVAGAAAQADYVGTLTKLSNYSSMKLRKTDTNGSLEVTCSTESGQYVQYRITPSTRYQYVAEVFATGISSGIAPTGSYAYGDLTTSGTFLGGTSTPYTTTVGAYWTRSITTTTDDASLVFYHYVDDRGGMWRISLVEVPDLTVDISTWAATGSGKEDAVFAIPDPGTYTVRGEFIGADPEHAPSNGTARGWLQPVTAAAPATLVVMEMGGTSVDQLSPKSNKDFAFKIRPASGGSYEFIPYHGTETEAFASATKYYDAGVPVDVAAMAVGETIDVTSFEWVQHIYGRNPFTGTENIIEVWTTQRIAANGLYSVNGRWKTLVDIVTESSVYPIMFMCNLPIFDEAISTIGGTYELDGSTAPTNIFVPEDDRADGWAFLSSTSDHVAACRYDNRRETLRVGEPGKRESGAITFIELRTGGTMAKVYPRIYSDGFTVAAGTVNRFAGDYFYGSIPGIRDALTLAE